MICTKNELAELYKKYQVNNVYQKREGLTFRIISDTIPESFNIISNEIGLEDVYLYYTECHNDNIT